MSFTQDELQAFTTILDQRLSAHRREMERSLDSRFATLRREFEQRLSSLNQELLRTIPRRLNEQHARTLEGLSQIVSSGQEHADQALARHLEQREDRQQGQFQHTMENALAAQLLAIEELIKQHTQSDFATFGEGATELELSSEYDSIELQTEIPWDDMAAAFDRVLEQRLSILDDSMQGMLKEVQNYLAVQMQSLHADLIQQQPAFASNITNIEEILTSIQQLEHIIESMQVAMNANHALLSNRIYHHQQLPLERAHPNNHSTRPSALSANGKKTPFPLLLEQEEPIEEEASSTPE
ncbi:hypothetical protein KSD_52910 [Ktedonobacter sp. SOSP1-85]|uniref:hypothetical protein n=1 Tax=Ktedonobacter sp. SOSP1-85 TaxID=2778367 RepID=UPI0019161347|nr:hypothetical protein [Ktedonobacter sp. SOSP1-85]GHO77520.1 hypothetical protein KSD_52910 [Ktedonobacter sp. SOSP1-85]